MKSLSRARDPSRAEGSGATRPRWVSLALCVTLSIALWWMFYPTVFSRDAFYMLLNAVQAGYSDMHPLLIPLAVSAVIRIGGDIGLVTLAQVLLGFLGIRRLVLALSHFIGLRNTRVSEFIVVAVLGILASPLTPLSIYLATLWSDTWLSIILLWFLALILELRQETLNGLGAGSRIGFAVVLVSLVLLVRYNAVVLYPALAAILIGVLRRYVPNKLGRIALVVLPIFAAASFLATQYAVHNVRREHPERAVFALDLASMILRDPGICQNLSLHSCELVLQEFFPAFRVGNGAIDLTFSQANQSQYQPFLDLFFYPRLETEYIMAVSDHPGLFIQVKLLNFIDYILPNAHQYFFQSRIIPEDARYLPEQAFASPDTPWFSAARQVYRSPWLSWFSHVHAVWILVCAVGIVAFGFQAWARLDDRAAFILGLLLVPASYYGSYLIALTTSEFRFMYPSTLLVQVGMLTFLGSALVGAIERLRSLRQI
ncbi:MAG: hypothetical protein V1755_13645 [Chloroflexota bacterium]